MQLTISGLSKTYHNGVEALKNVSLDISTGLFGLLGPNGAGKSTLMRILATLQQPDHGQVTFGNLNLLNQQQEVRKSLGYLPQEFGLYPRITAEVLLNHLAALKGIMKIPERREIVRAVLHRTNLYSDRKKNLGEFSGGMKQRFGIAQALLSNPKLIIVDEPTAGLDPAERNRFHNLLSELGEQSIVILSTHIVEDVKELCSNMAIIYKGQVVMQGAPQQAIAELHGKVYRKTIERNDLADHKRQYLVIGEKLVLGRPVIHIFSEGHPGNGFQSAEADLEDVYFARIFGSLSAYSSESEGTLHVV